MEFMTLVLAMGGQGGESGGGSGNLSLIFMVVAMVAIMWLLIFRPQRQREAKRREMLNQIKKSDHVVTIGGIMGVVTQIRGDEIVLKVDEANNVKITFTRSAIARVIDKSADSTEGEDAK